MFLWFCVAVRIAANPFSNVFQKWLTQQQASPLFLICMTHGLLSLGCIPIFLLALPHLPKDSGDQWRRRLLHGRRQCIDCRGPQVALDLSLLGPINSYKAVVSLLPGMLLLGEWPSALGAAGIALILFGSYFLVGQSTASSRRWAFANFYRERGVQLRLAALVLSAIEAVVLKKALLLGTPLASFAVWSLFGFVASLILVAAFLSRNELGRQLAIVRSNVRNYLLLALSTGLMQLSTIVVLENLQVSYALALFQVSTLLSVLLGWRFFSEGHIVQRSIGALVMAAGAVLIISGS